MPNPLYSTASRQCFLITPSDAHGIQGPVQSDGKPIRGCTRIYCTVSGNIVAKFADDANNASVTLPVIANTEYEWSLGWVYATGNTATIFGLL